VRKLVVKLIKKIQKGAIIGTHRLYSVIYAEFPTECQLFGFTGSKPIEPKFKNLIRFGLRDARDQGLIKHIGTPKSCLWERV
jgi:hypothetical protein